MRIHWTLVALIGVGQACSSANLKKAPFLTASTFVEESTNSNDAQVQAEVLEPVPMPTESRTQEESVSPPANISGTYLICSEMKAATMTSPESVVNCALRDQKTNNKVNIDASFGSKIWSYQAMEGNNLVVSMVELPQSLEWHIAVTLKSGSLADLQAQQGTVRFYVSVTNSAGMKYQETATISSSFVRWLSLNGSAVPTNAAIGGTEDQGRDKLYLCRVYYNGEVIPGKMSVHHRDASKSVCYATFNNSKVESQSDDGQTMLHATDVMVVTQGVFDDYFEWVPSSNGLKPAHAIVTGKDTLGNPLYTCRNVQVDKDVAEQTPGVLRPGSASCHHEFYGFESNTSYQVLAWKDTATQKIMDSRKPPTP
jgi:hypothetical protein